MPGVFDKELLAGWPRRLAALKGRNPFSGSGGGGDGSWEGGGKKGNSEEKWEF